MDIKEQIAGYINSQTEQKKIDMLELHHAILAYMPGCRLWFLDGKDETGKVVSNPNIGYGVLTISYADGKTREFYQVGLSANTSGISVYLMGIEDKQYLAAAYGHKIGKAKVTGYCIRFKALKDIDIDVLMTAIREVLR